jgi:hypothetical protein
MKELSNDLFFPILGITVFVAAIYAIRYKDKYSSYELPELGNELPETWSNLDDSNRILDPNSKPGTIVNNKCECPTCPQIPNAILPSYQSYNRDYRVLADPLYPPEQRSDSDYYLPREISEVVYSNTNSNNPVIVTRDNPMLYGNGYFRYPTRGYPPPYQMKGYLVDTNNPDNIISLFGRPKYLGSTEYQYYVSRRDANNNDIKIDIPNKREIFNDERIKIKKDIFNGDYKFVEYKTEDLMQPPIY